MSENKIDLRKNQIELLEKAAVLFEKGNMQPAVAKILALLLVSDNPELSFDEIRETLEISKSAASVAINQLLSSNRIEYITRLGDRKRYFRSRIKSWQEDMEEQNQGLKIAVDILQQIRDQRPTETVEFNANLEKIIAFLHFMIEELPDLHKKFEMKYQ
ncbi:GbsR/MarR family transcriptional regulator [Salmonirosea aquatica]|uniref:MarR family transcriptional regulator n=1 Tax=Salmonirosea aquatica TaxID=2654236 RepID=A0A7C9F730_9BACT|nr:MarR family transcriptional regulator [Cytophagaceae bacterium SJW1-29]